MVVYVVTLYLVILCFCLTGIERVQIRCFLIEGKVRHNVTLRSRKERKSTPIS